MRRTRTIVGLGGVAAIVLALVVTWSLRPSDPLRMAESAMKAGRWTEVVTQSDLRLKRNPADLKARQLRARGLSWLKRSEEGRAAYLRVGAAGMAPADFVAIAELLADDGRPALALLAIEAADRIDPGDEEVRSARTTLRARFGRNGEVAHVTDHLATIADGRALGEIVVSLAALAKGDSSDDPLVDRLLLRDRASLRTIDPAAAHRLIARALLEVGRPIDALERLGDDRSAEAEWLISRVELQAGNLRAAGDALARSGDFGPDHAHEPDPSLYVGSIACRKCHPKEYEAEQSSRHTTTLHHGLDLARIMLPDAPVRDPVDPKVVHTFTREGEKVRVETNVGDRSYSALMDYAIGSGHRGVTLIGKDSGGTYREARISQYSEHGLTWDVTSGFSPTPINPTEYLGQGLSAAGFRDCIHCHATRFRSISDRTGPEAVDRGIGCERCHGPGGNHVRAMENGFGDLAIARLTTATGPQRMAACSGCHQSDGTFPPADPQFIRFQSTTLPFSKCYVESKGKLDCVTCHDPHRKMDTEPAHYEAKCLSCHGPKSGEGMDEFRRVACPVNAKSDCLKCHMPRERDVVPHTSFTDHHIRVHREGTGR